MLLGIHSLLFFCGICGLSSHPSSMYFRVLLVRSSVYNAFEQSRQRLLSTAAAICCWWQRCETTMLPNANRSQTCKFRLLRVTQAKSCVPCTLRAFSRCLVSLRIFLGSRVVMSSCSLPRGRRRVDLRIHNSSIGSHQPGMFARNCRGPKEVL